MAEHRSGSSIRPEERDAPHGKLAQIVLQHESDWPPGWAAVPHCCSSCASCCEWPDDIALSETSEGVRSRARQVGFRQLARPSSNVARGGAKITDLPVWLDYNR